MPLNCPLKVAGVPMEIFRVSTYYKSPQGMSIVNMAAACPTGEPRNFTSCNSYEVAVMSPVALSSTGGVLFTNEVISWHVPRRVTPLLDGSFKIAEMHMGINGQRLDKAQMATRGYTLATTDFHIVLELPVGSPDGYYKVGESLDFICKTLVTGPFLYFIQIPWIIAEPCPRLPVPHHVYCGAYAWGTMAVS